MKNVQDGTLFFNDSEFPSQKFEILGNKKGQHDIDKYDFNGKTKSTLVFFRVHGL